MLVVVRRVTNMVVIAMHEVGVIPVRHGGMPAARGVDVHVPLVGDVQPRGPIGNIVDVVVMRVVDVPVVQVVRVVIVSDGGMAAQPIVDVGV